MPGFARMVPAKKRKRPPFKTKCRITSPWEGKTEDHKKMEGECKERPGVDGVVGERCEVAMTCTVLADPSTEEVAKWECGLKIACSYKMSDTLLFHEDRHIGQFIVQ